MSGRRRFVLSALVGWSFWCMPLNSQADAVVRYFGRGETRLAGTLLDSSRVEQVSFWAMNEDGVITIRINLESQSITVREEVNEFSIVSSNNTGGSFSTLSEDERLVLRKLATLLDEDLGSTNSFHVATICMTRHLGAWPEGMPLAVSLDSVMTTVGSVSVPNEEIAEARRRAVAEALPEAFPEARDQPPQPKAIVSFCSQIGTKGLACYPTRLVRYRERCDTILVGGTSCRGRCGTRCNGLCTGRKYTEDCFNHDRCVQRFGMYDRRCNFIFANAADDCLRARNCKDAPGVWRLRYTWSGKTRASIVRWYVYPDTGSGRNFISQKGGSGRWSASSTRMTLRYSSGCKPRYSGRLDANRTAAVSGTMRCTAGKGRGISGTWTATKRNTALPALSGASDQLDMSMPPVIGPSDSDPWSR